MHTPDRVAIAVRPLVEYAFRGGSLDDGFRSAASLTEGTRIHQSIQKEFGDGDRSEVYVCGELTCDGVIFVVDGRCDGVRAPGPDGIPTIEEIKSTAGELSAIPGDGFPVHWAQAHCYAFLYAVEHGLETMHVQLTYVQVGTDRRKIERRSCTLAQLEHFVQEVLRRYVPYARLLSRHRAERNASIGALGFPFTSYRRGQRRLAGAVYRSIEAGTGLFAEAPTGIGKTMSALFPAVKAIGEGVIDRLLYLTAKTTTRAAAEEALVRLAAGGLVLHAATITAKDKICFRETVDCRAEACEYADGHFDRVGEALLDLLGNETAMTRQTIEIYARKHRVCPFEFSLDAAYAADAVVCDYNYAFDPRVSLKRWTAEQKARTALLVDEAHNLVDRAREMYSAAISKRAFLELERAYKGVNEELHQAAKAVNRAFIDLRKREGGASYGMRELPAQLCAAAEVFAEAAERVLAAGGESHAVERVLASGSASHTAELVQASGSASHTAASLASEQGTSLLDVYFETLTFGRIAKLYDERYMTQVECRGGDVLLKLLCLDPSALLRGTAKGYRTRISFSATLSPLGFYCDVLGAAEHDRTIRIPSPFDPAQWDVSVLPISTRYADRLAGILPIAAAIGTHIERYTGNHLVFLPSYSYMGEVYAAFRELFPAIPTLLQLGDFDEADKENFLAAFVGGSAKTLAAFAVLGGVFSEGVDLVGDRLTGVVVVGVGLPQVGPERDAIRDFYDAAAPGRGFDYAYVFPGMNKVRQAGGRLIRSETDRGSLLLIDNRYLSPKYRQLLPEEWRNFTVLPRTASPG